jgi:hypothetical protein
VATGTQTTYNLSTGVKLNVENVIWIITPWDVPLQGTMGADGRTALSSDTVFEKKAEWLDEVLLVPNSTLGNTCATTDTYITVADDSGVTNAGSLNFQVGDVLFIDAEYMYVSAYGTTTDTLVVTKGYLGSTSTNHSNGAVIKGVGQALPEGSDMGNVRATDRVDRYNLTQIFGPTGIQVSGSENAVQKYGLTSTEFDKQVGNRTKEALVGFEHAVLYGTRYESTAGSYRTMGGFTYYITTNVDSTTTQLTEAALLTQLKSCFDKGGSPDRIVVGSKQKQNISGFSSPSSQLATVTNTVNAIRYSQDTNIRGQVVDYYDSDFGRQMVCLDRWCRTQDLFLFARDQATIGTLRPMTFEMLAKTGDSTKGQVVGEKTLYFRKQQHAATFNALT